MSKLTEYLDSAVGYDSSGLPASTTQFAFGYAPFSIAENENIEDVTEVSTICQSDAVVEIDVIDDFLKLTFDFATEIQTLVEMYQEVQNYISVKEHVTETLNGYMKEMSLAERNNNREAMEDLAVKIKVLDIPFFLPTIMPVVHQGTVHISFSDDPKFVMFVSDELNQTPYKLVMIFDVNSLFVQDEIGVYEYDAEDEIRAEQEEMWFADQARKAEEEAYQAQYGYDANSYYGGDEQPVDKRLKGVRITK